jgi:hypothetical protein
MNRSTKRELKIDIPGADPATWQSRRETMKKLMAVLLLSVLAAYGQHSLYIDTNLPNAHPLKRELMDKLQRSGKVKLVTVPEKADLILSLEETGRSLGTCTAGIFVDCGHRGRAVLKSRHSGEELWSEEKGGGWQWSGWSAAAVGRKLGNDLSNFLAEQTPAARSAETAGAPPSANRTSVAAFGMQARTSEDPDASGVEILDVADDGPAKAAGLRIGYVITEIDGKRVKTITDLLDELKSRPANSTVRVGYTFHTNLGWMGNAVIATLAPTDSHR